MLPKLRGNVSVLEGSGGDPRNFSTLQQIAISYEVLRRYAKPNRSWIAS